MKGSLDKKLGRHTLEIHREASRLEVEVTKLCPSSAELGGSSYCLSLLLSQQESGHLQILPTLLSWKRDV
jgi:hypothetical protein